MTCVFDSVFVLESELSGTALQRGWQYADGLFETMLFANGEVHLFEKHITRLRQGCQLLSLMPHRESMDSLLDNIISLVAMNQHGSTARIKVMVIRKAGGFYTPDTDEAHLLIFTLPSEGIAEREVKADISRKVFLHASPWSGIKSLNANKYVQAGIEKRNNKWEEILLCNTNGKVIESGNGNVIVYEEQANLIGLVDPKSFGIRGIMFDEIGQWLQANRPDITINPIYHQTKERLERATSILCCNSLSLNWIVELGDVALNPEPLQEILAPFIEKLPLAAQKNS